MSLTTDLKLAFPVRWAENPDAAAKPVPVIWAYHTPISREVFEANWRIIAATSAKLLERGVSPSIVNIAVLALKDAGRIDAAEYGVPEGVDVAAGGMAIPLLLEIRRLTMILAPGAAGYSMTPVDQAISGGIISADDWAEAEASLVFFTCGFSMAMRTRKETSALGLALILAGSITSLSPMDFAASLQTLTLAETSAAPAAESSVPS